MSSPAWNDEMTANRRTATGTLVSGLVLAGIGVLLLLDRFGIVRFTGTSQTSPVVAAGSASTSATVPLAAQKSADAAASFGTLALAASSTTSARVTDSS